MLFAIAVTVLVNSYYNHIIGWSLGTSFFTATGAYQGIQSTENFLSVYSRSS